jgi:putative ABC transport system substrate-binding protein
MVMRAYRVSVTWTLVLAFWLPAARGALASRPVIILTTSSVEAFGEAVEGIRRGLGRDADVHIIDLAAKPQAVSMLMEEYHPALLIAVGNNALEIAQEFGNAPIIATMLVRADLTATRPTPPVGAVVLDLPFRDVLAGFALAFPGRSRAGMIRGPGSSTAPAAGLIAQAQAAGITLRVVDCLLPDKLIQSLRSLREGVDFVWCPPDGSLFNGTTIRPVILASLESRLPLVGFSAGFVRAGGAAAIYPDYFEVGVQTGEMARRALAGINSQTEGPRKTHVAANPRVARLLGLKLPHYESGVVVIE